MPGRFVRSKIAGLAAEVLNNRYSRELLREHGWVEGTPIVVAQHTEKLSDVLGLVAVHQPPVFVVSLDPETSDLCFLYVALGCTALETVAPRKSDDSIRSLYLDAQSVPCYTFRIEQLTHSAIAHALPPMPQVSNVRYQAERSALGSN